MINIAVELGSYSLKFISFQNFKKSTQILKTDEVVIEEVYTNETEKLSAQILIIEEYIAQIDFEFQLFLTLSPEIISHRFLSLPVKSKKKAMMLLPFQVEEDLPNSLSSCHYAESLDTEGTSTNAIVGIVKKENFLEFYQGLTQSKLKPNIVTSDVSAFSNFIKQNLTQFPNNFCIVNIGHESTRSYYFLNGKIVTANHSYLAGKAITNAISETYGISYDEATLYKHQNSFLLLEEQYNQVNENQREFAKVMDTALAPLISEIKRWDIGFRVEHGIPIKNIYICGGTSNIKNIQNYLTEKLNVIVETFDPFIFMNDENVDQEDKLRRKFAVPAVLAANSTQKSKLINFLKGDYSLNSNNDFPLESLCFVALRGFILAFIISLYFLFQGISLNSKIKTAEAKAKSLYKNNALSETITKSIIRRSTGKPNVILNKLSLKDRTIMQEVKVIQSALKVNAFNHLSRISRMISGQDSEILSFSANAQGNIELIISSKEESNLIAIENSFKADPGAKWFLDLNSSKLTLTITGKVR